MPFTVISSPWWGVPLRWSRHLKRRYLPPPQPLWGIQVLNLKHRSHLLSTIKKTSFCPSFFFFSFFFCLWQLTCQYSVLFPHDFCPPSRISLTFLPVLFSSRTAFISDVCLTPSYLLAISCAPFQDLMRPQRVEIILYPSTKSVDIVYSLTTDVYFIPTASRPLHSY